jgi:PAS domain S-box-containing protein
MYERAYLAEANNAMAAMYGVKSPDELVGARLSELLVREDPRNTEYLLAFIKAKYALTGVDSHELDRQGNEKVFRNSLVGVVKDGMVIRAWGTQQDITEQYKAEAALRKSREHLALAMSASGMGTWEWDILTNELIWSDELKILFGLDPKEDINYEKYVKLLYPEDRVHTRKTIQASMKSGKEYRVEHRIIWRDGSIHWIMGQGKAILEDGRAVRMIGTSMNIDDIKRAEELAVLNIALKSREEHLIALNQSKDEFLSLASHQLRTPATVVKQYIGMILQGFVGELSEKQRAFLDMAYESNERQLQVINDLLNVARLDAGRVMLARKKTNLTALIVSIVKEHQPTFEGKNQSLLFERPHKNVSVSLDAARLRMAIDNLLDNACKYSPKDACATITVQATRHSITISVKDQGVGIAKKDLGRLFQKFSRLENKKTVTINGTGLGLYWAMKIVALHGGSIDVESSAGKGSVFRITLPRN